MQVAKDDIYKQIKETAWMLFVFRRTPETEVGYRRLECECPNLGKFLESYTADLGDNEAEGFDPEDDDEEQYGDNRNNKRLKVTGWREEKDAAWIKDLVERPDTQFIYQIPHLQTQRVCFGGLTKFRITLLQEFRNAAELFAYTGHVFSGSPAHVLEDLVETIPHGLTDQLDPFTWEHYRTPINEALCVYWHNLPVHFFNEIPCGNAPGETFQGTVSKICQENLFKVHNEWRKQLALDTLLCMKEDYDVGKFDNNMKDVLRASYPLKLIH